MKIPFALCLVIVASVAIACDPQSGITKKSLEKFGPTPTPSISPTPTEAPIDPADVANADTSAPGPTISVTPENGKKEVICNKYNRLMVNGRGMTLNVKGVCQQVMINGHENDVTLEAATEIVFNGRENSVRYWHYANGKHPIISGNKVENVAEKTAAPAKK